MSLLDNNQTHFNFRSWIWRIGISEFIEKSLPHDHQITVIDKSPYFMMGLVNLWILSGTTTLENSQVASNRLENKGIIFLSDDIICVDLSRNSAYYLLMPL